MAFGSCRTSVTHDEAGNKLHGVDALRAYALRMAGVTDGSHEDDPDPGREIRWPDLVLFLGDQVYADETTEEMKQFISSRRDIEQPPGKELKDWEEYAHLYRLAWSDPANRWLLSTLPTAMIFDDHDIRDDWNTSLEWKQEMERTSWWHGRIVAGLGSYWVYQHLGNMTPGRARRRRDLARDHRPRRRREGVRRLRPARRVRRPRRPGADVLPLELRPRDRRPGPAGRGGLTGRPGARARAALDARRRRDGLARRADARRRRPPPGRDVAAVPAQPRPAPRRGVQRGARGRSLGGLAAPASARSCGRPWTSSTGRRSRTASRRWPG